MQATAIPAALAEVAAHLTAAGVPTAVDPTKVHAPGGWVSIRDATPELLCGDFTVTGELYLVAKDVGHPAALATLMDMLDTAARVIPSLATATPDAVALPGHPGPLPALVATFTLED